MTGRGRPSTGTRIEVRVPVGVLASIDRHAESIGTTRAVVVREALAELFPDRSRSS